ncbi:TonB-dependent receptor, partial [bacterium]|nr:TonB-dependent receptor [bacterium]
VILIGSGVIQVAEGRRTPVAVSTIRAEEISTKAAGNVEFTEAMKNTPSVYVANQGSGFGDSQIFLRGFDDTNTAFLLNGQPINGQEDGRMYWSNWSGMSDVANAVQVQRGLGASKLAISSVGGTVNIVSKTTDKKEGGFVRFLGGNDSYAKATMNYNSGMSEKGWGFSVLLDHWQGYRKWAEGTQGGGQTYMISVGYKASEKSVFNFLLTGAPQFHDQNFSQNRSVYEQYGNKYNPNSGFLDGQRYTERRNYYHKPVANLNWDYEINDKVDLSAVLYASWGRGGGTGGLGFGRQRLDDGSGVRQMIDFEGTRANNIANADANGYGTGTVGEIGGARFTNSDAYIRRSSVNNHNWYGFLGNLNYDANENWDLSVGVDARMYTGDHFRQVNDLLGLNGYVDNNRADRPTDYTFTEEYEADPWSALFNYADEDNRTQYDYSESINYIGAFGQAEYATDHFSAFFQGAVSTQSFQRTGRFTGDTYRDTTGDQLLDTFIAGDGLGDSEKISKLGYNLKGGLGYSPNEASTFFVNGGFYSRQPYLDNIFADIRNSNAIVSPEIENEEVLSYEAGYRYNKGNLRINVDIYRTDWGNRFVSTGGQTTDENGADVFFTDRFTDVTQIHQGLEFDFEYRMDSDVLRWRGYGSIGNWKYDGETPFTRQNNETLDFIELDDNTLTLSGVKVGRAPQTSFGGGVVWNICNGLSFDADYNIYTDLYAAINADDVVESAQAGERAQSDRIDGYGLFDLGLTYKFMFGGNKLTLRTNLYNALNEDYITRQDNYGVGIGNGRTYNASLRYNF